MGHAPPPASAAVAAALWTSAHSEQCTSFARCSAPCVVRSVVLNARLHRDSHCQDGRLAWSAQPVTKTLAAP